MPDPTLFTPPAATRSVNSPSERVARIKAHAHTCHVTGRQSMDAARKAGKELIALKDELPHGEFIPTLKKLYSELPMRTAQNWMSYARNWNKIHDAPTLAEAAEIAAAGEEPLVEAEEEADPKYATVAYLPDPKAIPGKEKEKTPPEPDKPETPTERVKRKVSAILDSLADVTLDMEDVIVTPIGLRALEVAEELKLEVVKEFIGDEDNQGRVSDTKGESHYYPKPVKELIQWWTTFLGRLERPAEVDF